MSIFLNNIQVMKKNSASDTILFTGEFKQKPFEGTEVILKISLSSNISLDNSLLCELEIYKKVINKLYSSLITPHLTPCLGTFSCNDFLESSRLYLNNSQLK